MKQATRIGIRARARGLAKSCLMFSRTPVMMKKNGIRKPYPIEVSFSWVFSVGSRSFMTIPAKKAPRIFSAPTCSAIVTRMNIRKKASRISSWVVALEILLNQMKGCLNRFSRKNAARKRRTISQSRPALPPLIEA